MSDETRATNLQTLWKNQPEENTRMTLDQLVNRRTRELHASTRSEIGMSIAAALFFGAVIAWRFAETNSRIALFTALVVAAWVLVSLYRFRDRIRRQAALSDDALAATGVDHYRRELERRRSHLRDAWVWYGPLVAAAVLAWVVLRDALATLDRLLTVLPLVAILAVWIGSDILRRRRQAQELKREIETLSATRG